MKNSVKKADLQNCHIMNVKYLEIVKAVNDCRVNHESALTISNVASNVLRFVSVTGELMDKATDTQTGRTVFNTLWKAAHRYKTGEFSYNVETAVLKLGEAVFNCQTGDGKPVFVRHSLESAIVDTLQSLLTVSDMIDWKGNIAHGKNGVKYDIMVYFKSACRELGYTYENLF